jgi:hypothetical protein
MTYRVMVETLLPWPLEAPKYPAGTMLAIEWYGWKPPEQAPETKRTERIWQLTPTLTDAIGFTTEEDARSWATTVTTRATAEGQPLYRFFQIQRGNWPNSLDRAEAKIRKEYSETEGRPLRSRSIMGPRGPLIPGE